MAGVPFDQLDGDIWYNGEFVQWGDAQVHVLTHGLHYASAVFEGERAYGGEIFKLTEHTERLHKSAEYLGFEIPWTVQQIDDACKETLKRQGLTNAYVRPIAWRCSEMMGVSAQSNKINLAIAKSCNATIDKENGAESKDWRKGKPIRVVRTAKPNTKKKNKDGTFVIMNPYAPKEGCRLDTFHSC